MNLDSTLMEAIKECYAIADHWSTRRQILSVVVDKMSFKEIKTWIPDLSRYCYNVARHNRLLHGRGAVVPISTSTRIHRTQVVTRDRLHSSWRCEGLDDLQDVVEKLGDIHGKGLTWAKDQNEKLKNAKRYLKTDYKVLFSYKWINYTAHSVTNRT